MRMVENSPEVHEGQGIVPLVSVVKRHVLNSLYVLVIAHQPLLI